ncbi:MAG: O-antigen ligase family protein, partial [Planctomycetota bacterium]
MWGWSFLLLLGVFAWQARKAGLPRALGAVVILSLLVPTWAVLGYQLKRSELLFFGMPIDMRLAFSFIGISVCCLRPKTILPTRIVAADWAVLAIVAAHVISDLQNDGLSVVPPLRAFGEWMIPYLAGRIALRNMDDARELLPFAVTVCLVLAAVAVIESLARINLAELAYGARPVEGSSRDAARWGLKRAFGPAMHPIYFGTLQLLLMPWAIYAASRAARGRGPVWWYVVPAASAIGIFFSLSRGPILAVPIVLYIFALIGIPRWRPVLSATGVIATVLLAFQYATVLDLLQVWSGEAQQVRKAKITVNDEEVQYTGTLNRVYLLQVYGRALKQAGLFGYGTERVTGFPIRVPVGPEEAKTLKFVRFIDNEYVLLILR